MLKYCNNRKEKRLENHRYVKKMKKNYSIAKGIQMKWSLFLYSDYHLI